MESTRQVFGEIARNRALLRVVAAYSLFIVCEYGLWIVMLVYAYDQGGATTAGLVALAQLLPSAVTAPLAGQLADRRSPVTVLVVGYVVQCAASALTAVALFMDSPPLLAYAGAVVVSSAIATIRPSQSALLPGLTREVDELTATNVLIGWVENLGILVAGIGVGLALTFGSVGHAFAVAAVMLGVAAVLLMPLRSLTFGRRAVPGDEPPDLSGSTLATLWRVRPARLLVGLHGAAFLVIGALDVLFVVLAVDLLEVGPAWAGYLNTAYGAGALVLGGLSAFMIGRRLGPFIVLTALVAGAALVASAFSGLVLVVLLLAVVGGTRSLLDVAVRVLLQRTVAPDLLARLFGVAEGVSMLGLAAGSLLTPALVALGGPQVALIGVAAVLPVAVLIRLRVLFRLDQQARVPVVELALLRQLPIFHILPGDALEGMAQGLERVIFEPGRELIREGDEGDCYYAIADGTVDIRRRGNHVRTLHRGEGLGEIALLRSVRRTATAVAATPVVAYRLDRDLFLTAVNGHVPTLESAHRLVSETEAGDARRDAPPPPAST